jgi:hypothetical protein
MDHLPFWHWPNTAAGEGFGQGTRDIIEYMAYLRPSQYNRPYGWMVCLFVYVCMCVSVRVYVCMWVCVGVSVCVSVCQLDDQQDPDFLETLFYPTMSFIDSRTEFTFWCLWSSPLLIATDVRSMGV